MRLNLEEVKQDIDDWIENFLEVKHPDLGNWTPCPYARSARLKQSYEVRIGDHVLDDLLDLSRQGLQGKEVIIYAYPHNQYQAQDFRHLVRQANEMFLLNKDILALDDHPRDVEVVNGVTMNQGKYTLALVQCLSDLNAKAKLVANQGFYDTWDEEYLQTVFKYREDPRVDSNL